MGPMSFTFLWEPIGFNLNNNEYIHLGFRRDPGYVWATSYYLICQDKELPVHSGFGSNYLSHKDFWAIIYKTHKDGPQALVEYILAQMLGAP